MKLIRAIVIQLLSWTTQSERNVIRRKQAQGIEVEKVKRVFIVKRWIRCNKSRVKYLFEKSWKIFR